MKDYLQYNSEYWQKGYEAENVEGFVFRPYGRIFKFEFGIDGSRNERLLDWGCGWGAALRFFKSKGFDVYGVDISRVHIQRCKAIMPDIADHFELIDPEPNEQHLFFGGNFDLVIAIQSLYYLSDTHLKMCLKSLYNSMRPGGIIYATMMGVRHYYYQYSEEYQDGLRKVEFNLPRLQLKNYFVNFTLSEEQLLEKFGLFRRYHVGYYDAKYREDEGSSFHYTFVGQKI